MGTTQMFDSRPQTSVLLSLLVLVASLGIPQATAFCHDFDENMHNDDHRAFDQHHATHTYLDRHLHALHGLPSQVNTAARYHQGVLAAAHAATTAALHELDTLLVQQQHQQLWE